MANDRTLTFEKRRNVPVKYNRELVGKTLRAMKRVEEIKRRREKAHYAKRMQVRVECETRADLKVLTQHLEWVPDGKKKIVEKNIAAATKFLNREREKKRLALQLTNDAE